MQGGVLGSSSKSQTLSHNDLEPLGNLPVKQQISTSQNFELGNSESATLNQIDVTDELNLDARRHRSFPKVVSLFWTFGQIKPKNYIF